MAKPSTRQELIDYCKRQLGYPVLEINVADEQIQDLVDDAIQYFQERHFDGVAQVYLKYKITQGDIDRGRAKPPGTKNFKISFDENLIKFDSTKYTFDATTKTVSEGVGIASTSATTNIVGQQTKFTYYENSNYLQVPPDIIGINKVFQYDDAQSVSISNMFSFKYQMFLNDIYYWGTMDLLSYDMAMTYLETMNFLLNTHKQIRFNQRQDRMYLDVDWKNLRVGEYLIIDCYRAMDPNDYSRVWNDSFLKPYLTALIKRQWGQNMMKFQGVKLPGGIELNGRQMYEDAMKDLEVIQEKMSTTYELPPLDLIG